MEKGECEARREREVLCKPHELVLCSFCAGTSSFGMSGVIAHAILAQDLGRTLIDKPKQADLPWRKQRCWAAPAVSMLLTSAAAPAAMLEQLVAFSCRLDSAHLSYLSDHRCIPTTLSYT